MGGRSEISDAGGWREYSQLPTQAPIVLTSNMWYLMALTANCCWTCTLDNAECNLHQGRFWKIDTRHSI